MIGYDVIFYVKSGSRSTLVIVVFNFSASAIDAAPAPPILLPETHRHPTAQKDKTTARSHPQARRHSHDRFTLVIFGFNFSATAIPTAPTSPMSAP